MAAKVLEALGADAHDLQSLAAAKCSGSGAVCGERWPGARD